MILKVGNTYINMDVIDMIDLEYNEELGTTTLKIYTTYGDFIVELADLPTELYEDFSRNFFHIKSIETNEIISLEYIVELVVSRNV